MYNLVVFSALLAVACASVAPLHGYAAPIATSYGVAPLGVAPLVNTYSAHHIATPIVKTYEAAPVVAAAPIVKTYATPALAVGHHITKNVHYASHPVVTGYTSQVLKPDLGAIATPLDTVTKQRVLAPARTVATITPQVTQVEPELHVRKVPVDVPVPAPYVSEVEVRHPAPIVAAAPAVVAAPAVAAPIVEARVAHNFVAPAVAAAPIVEARVAHNFVAPAVSHNVISSPIVHSGIVSPHFGLTGLRTASVW